MKKTTRKNFTVKAFQTHLAKMEKQIPSIAKDTRFQRSIIGAANNRGDELKVEDVRKYFEDWTTANKKPDRIIYQLDWVTVTFANGFTAKPIKDAVLLWERIALTTDAEYFLPLMSYGLHRGDKLDVWDDRYIEATFSVSQRYRTLPTIAEAVRFAFNVNGIPFNANDVKAYTDRIKRAAKRNGVGNFTAGVMYDYACEQYKAVICEY